MNVIFQGFNLIAMGQFNYNFVIAITFYFIECDDDSQCPVDSPFCDVDDNFCKGIKINSDWQDF